MKIAAATLALLLLACSLSAQGVVKKDLIEMLDRVPPPPTSTKEAFGKVNPEGSARWSAGKFYEAIEKEAKEIEAAIGERMKPAGAVSAPGVPPDMAKTMQDPGMRKKMKTMSREEKMKMAMEMMKSAGKPVVEADPPAVRSVLEEWQKVYNETGAEFERSTEAQQRDIKIREEDEKAHADIDKWAQAEIDKLPRISSGEMSAPDPAKLKVVKLKANDKHVAVAEKRLRPIGESWRTSLAHAKARYSPFYQRLVASGYASGATTVATIKVLSDAQLMVLKDIFYLINLSRRSTEEAARWIGLRKEIEQE